MASDERKKKKAYDRRHKATQQRLAERTEAEGRRIFDDMNGRLFRKFERMSIEKIAFKWFPMDDPDQKLTDSLYLSMIASRVMGVGHFWYDLRAVGYDRFRKENQIKVVGRFASAAEYDNIPPLNEDAIYKWFSEKTPYRRDEFDAMIQIDKTNAFTIAGATEIRTITEVKEFALLAIRQNMSKHEFMVGVKDLFNRMGITPANKYHIRTIYNTNIHSAFNAGRYMEFFNPSDPGVAEFLPFAQYSTTGATNVCKICDPYDNLIFRRDDPTLQYIYPPNHYNCACSVVPVSVWEMEEEGLVPTDKSFIGDPDVPQPLRGFDGPPAMIGTLAA